MNMFESVNLLPSGHGPDNITTLTPTKLPGGGIVKGGVRVVRHNTSIEFTFDLHQHPFVHELMQALMRRRVAGLQEMDTTLTEVAFFDRVYDPEPSRAESSTVAKQSAHVAKPWPAYRLDFEYGGAYSIYNWELFFHLPITIAIHLSKSGRFEEARRWFHFVFDPTDRSTEPAPARYWKFERFKTMEVEQLATALRRLATNPALQTPPGIETDQARRQREQVLDGVRAWMQRPFEPHEVAKARPSAYMYKTFMAYVDNLIAWGDALFQTDSTENIDEALGYYIEAWNLMGDRPQQIPRAGTVKTVNYKALRGHLDELSNALGELESDLPFDVLGLPDAGSSGGSSATTSLGRQPLYFCVPHNDRLIAYWSTIADRLFKIRNSLNFRGIFRQLPLFDPPIDPGKLAAAAAAGVDISAIVTGANMPLPNVRFSFLLQKALAACQEAKSLGSQLLSALEKDDSEQLTLIRSRHEKEILTLAEGVRYGQVQEAGKSLEALQLSLDGAKQRLTYFERLLGGKPEEIRFPEYSPLDHDGLTTLKLRATETDMAPRTVDIDIVQTPAGPAKGLLISHHEAAELAASILSADLRVGAGVVDLLGTILGCIPQFNAHGTPMGVGAAVGFGGVQLGQMAGFMASALRISAEVAGDAAQLAGRVGGFARREQEWANQRNVVTSEINQMQKQLRAAEIRHAMAELELKNHQRQMEHAKEIDRFLTDPRQGKQANKELYAWMVREVKALYSQSFRYALDVARKAERALQYELNDTSVSLLGNGYSGGKQELLAGERLLADLQRMELEFHERQAPIVKPVISLSLADLDPLALLQLRATGRCRFQVPEQVLDREGPGEYFRRIRSVAVSVPCIVGPHAQLHCKVTLLQSSIRKSADLADGYSRAGADDPRFDDYFGMARSVIISSGQNDPGWIDDADSAVRYAPFEGHGLIGEWSIELPADPSKNEPTMFDYDTIRDVVLVVNYQARDGGQSLKDAAKAAMMAALAESAAAGAVQLFSIRHDFPASWERFSSHNPAVNGPAPVELDLRPEDYPYWSRGQRGQVDAAILLARGSNTMVLKAVAADGSDIPGQGNATPGAIHSLRLKDGLIPAVTGTATVYLKDNKMRDLWLLMLWKK